MGWVAPVFSAIGTVGSAFGALRGGQAASDQANYQAAVARNNATIANQNANYAVAAGEANAAEQGLAERNLMGSTRAKLGASGLDVNSGSAADVRQSVAQTGQVDLERVRQDAARRAYGYRAQAENFGAEAGLQSMAAKDARSAGLIKAGSLLFAGGSGLVGKWDKLSLTPTDDVGEPYYAYGAT